MNNSSMALKATIHCLTGCAIGEVAGMAISTAFNMSAAISYALAIALAFIFGYSLSLSSVLRGGISLRRAIPTVLAGDTLSITTMEITDNLVIALIPNAIHAQLNDLLFWTSMVLSLVTAFFAAFPVNRYLLQHGIGHALIHDAHSQHDHSTPSPEASGSHEHHG